MIADPIEETFPFEGHTEFLAAEGPARLRAPRAQSLRDAYLERLADHREAVRAACAARGWGFALHRTDASAAQALLALRARLAGPEPARAGWSAEMFGLPLAFAAPAALAALALLAALYLFRKVTPPRPREVVFPPLRLLIGLDRKDATPAKTPWSLLRAAHRRGGAGDPGDGGADLERLARQGRRAVADRCSTTAGRRRRAGSGARPTRAPRSKRRRAPGGWSRWRRRRKAAGARRARRARAARIACARSHPFLTRRSAWRRCRRSPISSPPIRRREVVWIADGVELGGATAFAARACRRRARPQIVGRARRRRRPLGSPAPTTTPARCRRI